MKYLFLILFGFLWGAFLTRKGFTMKTPGGMAMFLGGAFFITGVVDIIAHSLTK